MGSRGPCRQSASADGRRIVARRSTAAIAWRLALALAAVATPAAARSWGVEQPALFLLAFVAFPVGVVWSGRSVHAFFLPQSIELDDRGLHLAWADKVTFLPWMAHHTHEVPWASLRGVTTKTLTVNGISTTSLVVTTADKSFEIPDHGFDRCADLVQRDILDCIARARERPVAETSAFVERCRKRFAKPQRFVASPTKHLWATLFFVPFIGFPIWFALQVPFWLTYGFAALALAVFGGLIVLGFTHWYRGRVLVMSADGLAIGPSESRARAIRWEDIRLVRRDVVNGKTEGIEIVCEDSRRLSVRQAYGLSFDELARRIDPERN